MIACIRSRDVMFLRQKCPNCGTEVEFVYVQIGHGICCKKCNYEFTLTVKRRPILPYLIVLTGLVILGVVGFYTFKTFHDWWIYR